MSYEVNNYVFRGVPLSEFLERLDHNPAGSHAFLVNWHYPARFILVEENLVRSLQQTQDQSEFKISGNSINPEKIAECVAYEQNGCSPDGPKMLLFLTLLRVCGISLDDIKSVTEADDENLSARFDFDLNELRGFPLAERNREPLPMGLIRIPSTFEEFALIAQKNADWQVVRDFIEFDEEACEFNEPVFRIDVKKNIEWAKTSRFRDWLNYWREEFCALVINLYIKPGEEYVEEDDCWTNKVGVCSTRYGDILQDGGMEKKVMYLIVSGTDMHQYDEDGWKDPQKHTPVAFKKVKGLLFGDPDYPTTKYTPVFGG